MYTYFRIVSEQIKDDERARTNTRLEGIQKYMQKSSAGNLKGGNHFKVGGRRLPLTVNTKKGLTGNR
jgi:hypothetical protein